MRMWARARIHLRLSEDEFWRLTPRQLQSLYRSQEDLLAHHEFCTGIVAATLINVMCGPKEPARPSSFFGSRWAKSTEKRVTVIPPEVVADRVRARLEALMQSQVKTHG